MSFWVKSNKTGLYVMELFDGDNSRQVSASYSVNASDTWEEKTLTFPADTTGAFDNDNASSLTVRYWLAAGSTYTSGTLQTTWASPTSANRAAGQTNLGDATSNYWQVTGVQLEVGPIASTFQFKPYGQELRECQRYCFNFGAPSGSAHANGFMRSTTAADVLIFFPVQMRSSPSAPAATSGNAFLVSDQADTSADFSGNMYNASNHSCNARFTPTSARTAGIAISVMSQTTTPLIFSAEL
jgi:hypothetical protein